jgi:nitrate reductase gamma subunit
MTLSIAFGQKKIFRKPVPGTLHALVFWGFLVVSFGSIEMVIDGVLGTEKNLDFLGVLYKMMMISGDIFAYIVFLGILVFIIRRSILKIKRFEGIEMKRKSHIDAIISLFSILILMISLIAINVSISVLNTDNTHNLFPISSLFAHLFETSEISNIFLMYKINWWVHILVIFAFANYLPYSKHFHVFMSIPNVFLSRLEPLGKLMNMEQVSKEVRLMLYPDTETVEDNPIWQDSG